MTPTNAVNARTVARLVLPLVLAWTAFQGCRIKEFDVELTGLVVSPATATRALGANQQFAAVATYSDDSTAEVTAQATWTSSNTSVASIDGGGVATPAGPGTATITASWQGTTGTATLTVTDASLVSIAVTPGTPSIANGTRQQFTAIGTYNDQSKMDITTSVTWTSSHADVTFDANGLATSTALGSATSTITASLGSVSGSTELTVRGVTLDALVLTPANPTIFIDGLQDFVATGSFSDGTTQVMTAEVTWTSSSAAIAAAEAVPGRFRGKGEGDAIITATSSELLGAKSGTTTLRVRKLGGS